MPKMIVRKGMRFFYAPSLTLRDAEKDDTYMGGRLLPDQGNYMVIVRKKDCPVVAERDGVKYIDPKGVLPHYSVRLTGHSRTNMAYGSTKPCGPKKSNFEYTMVYWGEDGEVYSGRIYRLIKGKSIFCRDKAACISWLSEFSEINKGAKMLIVVSPHGEYEIHVADGEFGQYLQTMLQTGSPSCWGDLVGVFESPEEAEKVLEDFSPKS